MSGLRRVARALASPLRHLLDSRFADVNRRLASLGATTSAGLAENDSRLVAMKADLDQAISGYAINTLETVTFLGAQLRELQGEIQDVRGDILEVRERIELLAEERVAQAVRVRFAQLSRGAPEDLDGPAAELLNYAFGHTGFAAQSELWMNPPLSIEHSQGEVRLAAVNERIVEVPFTLRAITSLPAGAKVLDFGSSENSLALSLASLGYHVTALDVREYPFEHPQLTAVASPIGEWDAEPGSFEAALCVSTVEHVGLGWYGDPKMGDGDRQALDVIAAALRPGGLLVLTVPYGTAGEDALERRYDRLTLDALLDGWDVVERQIVERADDGNTWLPVEESSSHAVALVVSRKPLT